MIWAFVLTERASAGETPGNRRERAGEVHQLPLSSLEPCSGSFTGRSTGAELVRVRMQTSCRVLGPPAASS